MKPTLVDSGRKAPAYPEYEDEEEVAEMRPSSFFEEEKFHENLQEKEGRESSWLYAWSW